MSDTHQALEAHAQNMITEQLSIAQKYVSDIDDILKKLQTERDDVIRASHWQSVSILQSKIEQTKNPMERWRKELNRLNQITIDKYQGKCTVCHQSGHKTEECSAKATAS